MYVCHFKHRLRIVEMNHPENLLFCEESLQSFGFRKEGGTFISAPHILLALCGLLQCALQFVALKKYSAFNVLVIKINCHHFCHTKLVFIEGSALPKHCIRCVRLV